MTWTFEAVRGFGRKIRRSLLVALLSATMATSFEIPQASAQMGLFFHMLRAAGAFRYHRGARRHYAGPRRHHVARSRYAPAYRTVRGGHRRGGTAVTSQPTTPEPGNQKFLPPLSGAAGVATQPGAAIGSPGVASPLPLKVPPSQPQPVSAPIAGANPIDAPPANVVRSPTPAAQPSPPSRVAPDEIKPKDD